MLKLNLPSFTVRTLTLLFALVASAQTTANISGTVHDATGAVLTNAQITVRTSVSTSCVHVNGDSWRCSCDWVNSNPTLELEAHDPESACALAAETCPRQASLQ